MKTLARIAMIAMPIALSAAIPAFSQMEDYGEEGEHFFMSAAVDVHLVGRDSVRIDFSGPAEDMLNTVYIFPNGDADTASLRAYERKIEAYLQERVPVRVDGKRVPLKVVQWKPGGKGRADGFDSSASYSPQKITLGGKIPLQRKWIEVTANVWTERHDAGETVVKVTLSEENRLLERRWTRRERPQRFLLDSESLKRMRANPPGPEPEPDPEP